MQGATLELKDAPVQSSGRAFEAQVGSPECCILVGATLELKDAPVQYSSLRVAGLMWPRFNMPTKLRSLH
jgi:hypothetical protein